MLKYILKGSNINISNKSTNFREVQNNGKKSKKHHQQQWQRSP